MIYKKATLHINNNHFDLGSIASAGKNNVYRKIIEVGTQICDIIDTNYDDAGEFDFIWSVKDKTWFFYAESGEQIGFIKIEKDVDATNASNEAYYKECNAAYEASKREYSIYDS